jgi:hypothetical protein
VPTAGEPGNDGVGECLRAHAALLENAGGPGYPIDAQLEGCAYHDA